MLADGFALFRVILGNFGWFWFVLDAFCWFRMVYWFSSYLSINQSHKVRRISVEANFSLL